MFSSILYGTHLDVLVIQSRPDVNGVRHNRQAGAGIAASRPLQVDVPADSF
jgi:hypothetical protein